MKSLSSSLSLSHRRRDISSPPTLPPSAAALDSLTAADIANLPVATVVYGTSAAGAQAPGEPSAAGAAPSSSFSSSSSSHTVSLSTPGTAVGSSSSSSSVARGSGARGRSLTTNLARMLVSTSVPYQTGPGASSATTALGVGATETGYMYRHDLSRLPENMTHEQLDDVLDGLERLVCLTETRWRFGHVRMGADTLMSALPGGDLLRTAITAYLASQGARLALPESTRKVMWRRVGIDFVFGGIPFLGGVFNIAYKANRRIVDDILVYFGRIPLRERQTGRGRERLMRA